MITNFVNYAGIATSDIRTSDYKTTRRSQSISKDVLLLSNVSWVGPEVPRGFEVTLHT